MREALLRSAGRFFGAFLLDEARCPACGRAFAPERGGGNSLCPECRAERRPAEPRIEAFPVGEGPVGPQPLGRLVAAGPYAGRLREMILAYKFSGRLDLGRQLQELLFAAFEHGAAECPELAACELLVPVPLHRRRLFSRGYNQSCELARLLSARRRLPIAREALVRVRRTAPQMTLGAAARRRNIRGAFAVRGRAVPGRRVLLVDDIMTTGSTLAECGRILLAAGAARVDGLVLCRA